jgi:hypothetical protein
MPSSSTRSSELQHDINEIQSLLRKSIEAARPAHEANLRAARLNPSPDAAPKSTRADAAKPRNARATVATHAKKYLRASKRPARKSAAAPKFLGSPRPDLARHRRKCQICHHPDRETIEDLFIHWHSAQAICDFFNPEEDPEDYYIAEDPQDSNEPIITWVAIYRHAYALGLDEIRRRNLSFAFEHIIENAGDITPTSAGVIAAARAYAACINGEGRWSDPPKQVFVTTIVKKEEPASPAPGDSAFVAADVFYRPTPETQTAAKNQSAPAGDECPPFSECGGSTRGLRVPLASAPAPSPGEIRNSRNPHITKENSISNR